MAFTGVELAALKKAAVLIGKAAFTGPGPGAGLVDHPIRASHVPGLERRKATIEPDDLERFARQVVKRTPELDPETGTRVAEALGALVLGLPYSCIDMRLMLDLRMRPEGLRDALLAVFPTIRRSVGDDVEPALAMLADAACPHIVEFFTRRENYSAAAITHLVAQGGDRFAEDQVSSLLTDYAVLVRKKFNQMRLFGLDLGPADRALDLMTGFVDLTVESLDAPGRGGGTAPRRVEWSRMGALVEERQRVLLEGPAGAGKSTLLQQLTLAGIEAFTPGGPPAPGAGPTVPFLLRLREFVKDGGLTLPNIDELLTTLAPGLGGLMHGWERRLLKTGNAAVYVDGVDEIPESVRQDALDWITNLVAVYPFARVVVTSRAAGVDETWRRELSRAGFTSAVINPMSTAQVTTFVERWHQAAVRQWPDMESDLEGRTAELIEAIQSRRDLARIATTPLLCAMICALFHSDNGILPQNRTALYERAFAMFFEKRDSHTKIQTFRAPMSREQVERFVAEFALWMLLERRRNIPKTVALTKVTAILPSLRFRGDWTPEPEDMLKYLIERCGVLQEPTMEELEFRHPSFQDYLAAKRVLQEEHYNLLIDNAHDALYQDVMMMAVGQAQSNSKVQGRLLEGLLKRCATELDEVARQLSLLALACIADVGMVDPQWAAAIHQRTKALLPPRNPDEARAIATGAFVLDLLADVVKRPDPLSPAEAEATVAAVSLINPDDPTARAVMRTVSSHRTYDVRKKLLAAWHLSKDPDAFREQLLAPLDFRGLPVTVARPQFLPKIKTLRNVEALVATGFQATHVGHAAAIRHLSMLILTDSRLRDLSVLKDVPLLQELGFAGDGMPSIMEWPTNVKTLIGSFNGHMPHSAFNELAHIERLVLWSGVRLSLKSLADLPKLSFLELRDRRLGELWDLAFVPNVTRLGWFSNAYTDVTPLPRLETLTHLRIPRHSALDTRVIARVPRLTELDLVGSAPVDLRPLTDLPNLRKLGLATLDDIDTGVLNDIPEVVLTFDARDRDENRQVGMHPAVTELRILGARWINVRGLERYPRVTSLALDDLSPANLSALADTPNITDLHLDSAVGIDLPALAAQPHLRRVTFDRTAGVDLAPLAVNPRLQVTIAGPTAFWSA